MEGLLLEAAPFLRLIFEHYSVEGQMPQRAVTRMSEDLQISPKFLSTAEVARIAHWAGSATLGGQLDYDHFCLWLAKANPNPNPYTFRLVS